MKKLYLLSLVFLFIPFLAGASFDKNLYYGLQKDVQVKELQEFLIDGGYMSGSATGNFFSLTLTGVKKFQLANSISPTSGYFGPKTRLVANAILAQATSDSASDSISDNNPPPVAPANTNDVVSSINQLQQTVQQQAQSITQIQQNTQQIVQNTAPSDTPQPTVYSELKLTCTGQADNLVVTYSDGTPPSYIPAIKWIISATGGTGIYTYLWDNGSGNITDTFLQRMGNIGGNLSDLLKEYDLDGNGIAENMVSVFGESGNQTKYVHCSIVIP